MTRLISAEAFRLRRPATIIVIGVAILIGVVVVRGAVQDLGDAAAPLDDAQLCAPIGLEPGPACRDTLARSSVDDSRLDPGRYDSSTGRLVLSLRAFASLPVLLAFGVLAVIVSVGDVTTVAAGHARQLGRTPVVTLGTRVGLLMCVTVAALASATFVQSLLVAVPAAGPSTSVVTAGEALRVVVGVALAATVVVSLGAAIGVMVANGLAAVGLLVAGVVAWANASSLPFAGRVLWGVERLIVAPEGDPTGPGSAWPGVPPELHPPSATATAVLALGACVVFLTAADLALKYRNLP